jgi:hypothetical protein
MKQVAIVSETRSPPKKGGRLGDLGNDRIGVSGESAGADFALILAISSGRLHNHAVIDDSPYSGPLRPVRDNAVCGSVDGLDVESQQLV